MSLLEAAGAQPKNPSRGKPIHIARLETGLFTNRSALHDSASWYQSKYGGFPDALIDGSNMEISNQLTLIRRPGLSEWSSVTVADQVNWFYDWRTLSCGPKVVVDTTTSTYIQTSTAQSKIFTKTGAAGQGQYQGVADTLYYGDGVDLQKFSLSILGGFGTGGGSIDCNISHGKSLNWGFAGPLVAPTVTPVASGLAASVWQKNTNFTTMGLTVDTVGSPNNNVWQLIGVNADGTNTPGAQFGTAGDGAPGWKQGIYITTTETQPGGTKEVWKNLGQILPRQKAFQYADGGTSNSNASLTTIYDAASQSLYINMNGGGSLSNPTAYDNGPSFSGAPNPSGWWESNHSAHWFFLCNYPSVGGSYVAQPWKSSHAYATWYAGNANSGNCAIEPFIFPPPTGQAIYLQIPTNVATSGSGYSPFLATNIAGDQIPENPGQLTWLCLGSKDWQAAHAYTPWTGQGSVFGCVQDQAGNMQVCVTPAGITGVSATIKPGTKSLTLTNAGNFSGSNTSYTGTFTAHFIVGDPVYISGFTNAANNGLFTVVAGTTGTTLIVNNPGGVAEAATAVAIFNPWAASYNGTTVDGTVTWVCVGPPTAWAGGSATTGIWNLPSSGFQPPVASQKFGGSLIASNTSVVEAAVVSGKSGTPTEPTWGVQGTYLAEGTPLAVTSVAVATGMVTYTGTITSGGANAFANKTFLIDGFAAAGNNGLILVTASSATTLVCALTTQVTDAGAVTGHATTGLTWYGESAVASVGLTSTKGYYYAYSFESRTATDQYNNIAPPGGGPPAGLNPGALGYPTGGASGHISTASPTTFVGPEPASSVNTITGLGSTDPQVDTIVIWRTLDGGSDLFYLTELVAPPPLGGDAQPWIFKDFLADTIVNEFVSAPINNTNNPPPAGFLPMAYHFERIWGAVGNFVYASGGPDVVTGDPNESFSPDDYFEFPSPVTRIVPTATMILVFLTSDVYAICGGPVFSTFFATPMVPGIGLLHYNALDVHGGVVYLFTSDNQFISMDPSGGAQRMGGPIADKLALFDSTKTFVTVHESGNDNAVFISDGEVGWYRLNPCQFPNNTQVWSLLGAATGGAGAVQSIEVTSGVHRLLVGGLGSSKHILMRDYTTYQDDGVPYTCSFIMGSINLVSPGQIAGLTFVNLRATRVGTAPTCSFLLNEVSGSFTTFPESQAYPWQIYGATAQPTSLFSNAYYFRATGKPALAEHMQVQVSFPAENFANEVLSLTIYGVIEAPPEE